MKDPFIVMLQLTLHAAASPTFCIVINIGAISVIESAGVGIAKYDEKKINELLNDEGIIRNKLKILATINNAKRFVEVQNEYGSFDKYIWQFVGDKPIVNKWKTMRELPAKTKESDKMSNDLKRRGFKFVGSTICYAFMQAVGMVNDHVRECFRHAPIAAISQSD